MSNMSRERFNELQAFEKNNPDNMDEIREKNVKNTRNLILGIFCTFGLSALALTLLAPLAIGFIKQQLAKKS